LLVLVQVQVRTHAVFAAGLLADFLISHLVQVCCEQLNAVHVIEHIQFLVRGVLAVVTTPNRQEQHRLASFLEDECDRDRTA
jgi:hypothetical protein